MYFNPRSHEGSDYSYSFATPPTNISIHAPTRGATILCNVLLLIVTYFNPRSHEGSDDYTLFQKIFPLVFQSTLPRGERLKYACCCTSLLKNFNPRSHEGSDRDTYWVTVATANFNPRSHEGSDRYQHGRWIYTDMISIHAPTRGATLEKLKEIYRH